MNTLIETRDLGVSFHRGMRAFEKVAIRAGLGESIAVIGPSGCGKSTLLATLSGILKPTEGKVFYRGEEVIAPSKERVMIFQDHSLFPWKSARENVIFALRARGASESELSDKADEYLSMVGLKDFADFYPHQLSGGMQQRVGIARALAAEPQALLLDEPFSALDMIHREILLQDFKALVRRLKKSVILVTHNIVEAIYLADRIYLMSNRPGRVDEEIVVDFARPEKILDFGGHAQVAELERRIHAHLYKSLV